MKTAQFVQGQCEFLKRASTGAGAGIGAATGAGMGALAGIPLGAVGGAVRYGFLSDKEREQASLLNHLLAGAGIGAVTGGSLGLVPGALGGAAVGSVQEQLAKQTQ